MDFFNVEPNEKVVREWHYAMEKKGRGSSEIKEHTLIITDKRVIHTAKSKRSNLRQEVKLSKICACEANYIKESLTKAIILISIGVLLSLLTLTFFKYTELLGGFLGVIFIFWGIFSWKRAGFRFEVRIFVEGAAPSPTMGISINTIFKSKFFQSMSFMKIAVDRAMAEEIVETFGNIVLGKNGIEQNKDLQTVGETDIDG